MPAVRYDLAVASWKTSEILMIVTVTDNPIAYLPLDFVTRGGHPQWAYVLHVVQQITDQVPGVQWNIFTEDGSPVLAGTVPQPGKFVYRCQGTSPVAPFTHEAYVLGEC